MSRLSVILNQENINLFYKDVFPSKNIVNRTVVACHGAPGSHKDFKYIVGPLTDKGLRFLAFDWPGFGSTKKGSFTNTSEERSALLEKFHEETNLVSSDVLISHSAGTFGVLWFAARHPNRVKSLLLINPPGLEVVRPFSFPIYRFSVFLYQNFWFLKPLVKIWMTFFIKYIQGQHFPFKNRQEIMNVYETLGQFQHWKVPDILQKLNPKTPLVIFYSTKDPRVPTWISEKLVKFIGITEKSQLTINDGSNVPETVEKFKELLNSGYTRIAFRCEKGGHYVQKHFAELIAEVCYCLTQYNSVALKANL